MDTEQKRMPGRAMGLKWLAVDQAARTLQGRARDSSEGRIRLPNSRFPSPFHGLKSGEEARVVLTAVDVGILNLTRFEAPKPEGWFHGQRKLGFEIRDFYSRLIDGMRAERGKLRSGGDGSASGMSMNGSPPADAIVSLYSGIVTVGADGKADIPFKLPDFNGTVRVSAVAWSGERVGSASKDVLVRDAIAVTVSAPRFLTLGDEARLQLDVHNVEGPAARTRHRDHAAPADGMKGEAVGLQAKSLELKALERKSRQSLLKPAEVGRMDARRRRHGSRWDRRRAPRRIRREAAGRRHQARQRQHARSQGAASSPCRPTCCRI